MCVCVFNTTVKKTGYKFEREREKDCQVVVGGSKGKEGVMSLYYNFKIKMALKNIL